MTVALENALKVSEFETEALPKSSIDPILYPLPWYHKTPYHCHGLGNILSSRLYEQDWKTGRISRNISISTRGFAYVLQRPLPSQMDTVPLSLSDRKFIQKVVLLRSQSIARNATGMRNAQTSIRFLAGGRKQTIPRQANSSIGNIWIETVENYAESLKISAQSMQKAYAKGKDVYAFRHDVILNRTNKDGTESPFTRVIYGTFNGDKKIHVISTCYYATAPSYPGKRLGAR